MPRCWWACAGASSISTSEVSISRAAPVRFCESASCSSIARRVLSSTLRSAKTRATVSSVSSRPRRSARRFSERFHVKMPAIAASSAPMTVSRRPGVHHGGRERIFTSSGVRTTIANPSMRGKGAFGRQLSVSIRHVPETSSRHPTSTFAKASGRALASTGTIRLPHSRPRRSFGCSGAGRLRTSPLIRTGCPWYSICKAHLSCKFVKRQSIVRSVGRGSGSILASPFLQIARERLRR